MNIFALHQNPVLAAQYHLDKHVVKMITEYNQIASTAHRVIDGVPIELRVNNRKRNTFVFKDETVNIIEKDGRQVLDLQPVTCYVASHINHPSSKWARTTKENYLWLVELITALHAEFEFRYNKEHAGKKLLPFLSNAPKNLKSSTLTPFAQAMPDEYQNENDPIAAYRAFYLGSKKRFATWTKREVPDWFAAGLKPGESVIDFQRVRNSH